MNSGGSADKPIITLSEPIKIDFPVNEREKEFDEYLKRIENKMFDNESIDEKRQDSFKTFINSDEGAK